MTIEQVAGDFARRVTFDRGYDCKRECSHEVKGEHGIAGVRIRFVLVGPAGATQFVYGTNWYPATVTSPYLGRDYRGMAHDLGFHAYEPQYEGQYHTERCDYLIGDGGCYYDGSSLNADPVFERLVNEGDDGVWSALQDYYDELFRSAVVA